MVYADQQCFCLANYLYLLNILYQMFYMRTQLNLVFHMEQQLFLLIPRFQILYAR